MLKLCNRNSFDYNFKDSKGEQIVGTAYRFEFYSEDFAGTLFAKVSKNVYDRYDELKKNPDLRYLLSMTKEHQLYLKCII